MATALATASTAEVARRCCGAAFTHLDVPDKAIYRPALRHHSPAVRAWAANALQQLKARAEPFLPDLIALPTAVHKVFLVAFDEEARDLLVAALQDEAELGRR